MHVRSRDVLQRRLPARACISPDLEPFLGWSCASGDMLLVSRWVHCTPCCKLMFGCFSLISHHTCILHVHSRDPADECWYSICAVSKDMHCISRGVLEHSSLQDRTSSPSQNFVAKQQATKCCKPFSEHAASLVCLRECSPFSLSP
jgi:hypothetical protein